MLVTDPHKLGLLHQIGLLHHPLGQLGTYPNEASLFLEMVLIPEASIILLSLHHHLFLRCQTSIWEILASIFEPLL
jgi:hypothetical protein